MTKRYGQLVACHDVSIRVEPGEVVGLLGQNGAGKTTLMKVICGIEHHDGGSIQYAGEVLRPGDSGRARDLGIAMVHQEFSLVGALSVWENVALAQTGALRPAWTVDRIRQLSDTYSLGLSGELDSRGDSLSVATRQRIEIAKCLISKPRLILLDEPTAILSREEGKHLFGIVRGLVKDSGVAVIVSNHRLDEVLELADRVVILRNGVVTGQMPTSEATEAILAREMLGEELVRVSDASALLGLTETSAPGNTNVTPGGGPGPRAAGGATRTLRQRSSEVAALEVRGVTLARPNGAPALNDLSLTVSRGEVVGLVGVEGNGQTELVDVLSNRRRAERGSVRMAPRTDDTLRSSLSPALGLVSSDRQRHGCVPGMSVAENLFLGNLGCVSRHRVIRKGELNRKARQLIDEFEIKCDGPATPMWTLSGGHQQRVVLARELARQPSVLVVDQPTRGLDIAAVDAVWSRLRDAAAAGIGVLVVSSDLVEILHLADRVLVISRGSITGELRPDALDVEALGLLIGGSEASAAS